jgi:cytochrome b561
MARLLSRYSMVAIVLHWLIAVLLLLNLWIGLGLGARHGQTGLDRLQLHQSVGLTILALSLFRLGWRVANPPPPDAPGMAHWEKTASNAVHTAFYLVMIGMPLSGWLLVSASAKAGPMMLFGVGHFSGIPWPHLPVGSHLTPQQRRALGRAATAIHSYLADGAYVLLALHLMGALKHQLFDPNPVLPRMLPFLKKRGQLT